MVNWDKQNKILQITRGDSAIFDVHLKDENGDPYIIGATDVIRFAAKKSYSDAEPCILVECDITTDLETNETSCTLSIPPEATKDLPFGAYKFDMQLTTTAGYVSTFIDKATLKITEEID